MLTQESRSFDGLGEVSLGAVSGFADLPQLLSRSEGYKVNKSMIGSVQFTVGAEAVHLHEHSQRLRIDLGPINLSLDTSHNSLIRIDLPVKTTFHSTNRLSSASTDYMIDFPLFCQQLAALRTTDYTGNSKCILKNVALKLDGFDQIINRV